jgi:hypothetical protein
MSIEKKKLTHEQKTKEYNEVRQELIKNKEFDGLNFENNIYWLHIDVGNRKNRLFNP